MILRFGSKFSSRLRLVKVWQGVKSVRNTQSKPYSNSEKFLVKLNPLSKKISAPAKILHPR